LRVLSSVNQKKKNDIHPAVLRQFEYLKQQERQKKLVKYGLIAAVAVTLVGAIFALTSFGASGNGNSGNAAKK